MPALMLPLLPLSGAVGQPVILVSAAAAAAAAASADAAAVPRLLQPMPGLWAKRYSMIPAKYEEQELIKLDSSFDNRTPGIAYKVRHATINNWSSAAVAAAMAAGCWLLLLLLLLLPICLLDLCRH